jgi:hypothetical protein
MTGTAKEESRVVDQSFDKGTYGPTFTINGWSIGKVGDKSSRRAK